MAASSTANTQRPRILLQFNQHKEGSVPAIRTVQGDLESDVVMGQVHERDNVENVDGPTTEEEFEDEDEEDDEVDQLVSSEDESQVKAGMSASAATASKPRTRAPRNSLQPPIPLGRLEGMLDSEISEAISKEAKFVLSAATDAFIKRLADIGHKKASAMKRNTVTYHDVASAVHERHELFFLGETVPQPLGLAEALRLREVKERNILEPLLSTPAPAPARPFTISVPPQAHGPLSITLPARSISVSNSASGSNAPSPRLHIKPNLPALVPSPLPIPLPAASPASTSMTASTSASKPPPTKGKRKAKQANGETVPNVNGATSTPAVETKPPTPMNGTPVPPAPPAAEPSSVPAAQPRRMSMREPKPRRRPDDMDDPPRPPPAPPTSPVKENANANTAPAVKTRKPRAKGKGKAKADPKPASNAATAGRNGTNHSHTNGHATMMTRSRRGSSAVVPQVQTTAPELHTGEHLGDGGVSSSGPGSVAMDVSGVAGENGIMENPGRTIYTAKESTDAAPAL